VVAIHRAIRVSKYRWEAQFSLTGNEPGWRWMKWRSSLPQEQLQLETPGEASSSYPYGKALLVALCAELDSVSRTEQCGGGVLTLKGADSGMVENKSNNSLFSFVPSVFFKERFP